MPVPHTKFIPGKSNCGNCLAWQNGAGDLEPDIGRCCRHAPRPVYALDTYENDVAADAYPPRTAKTQFCLEWLPGS